MCGFECAFASEMASEAEASCIGDPNFAVICSFLERFSQTCGIVHPDFKDLQNMLENGEQVDTQLIDLHVKLLRKARKSFTTEKWEKALVKFCHAYSFEDSAQIESLGYLKVPLSIKIRLLKALLEAQFDLNVKFKSAINKLTASELRLAPLGRDTDGQVYWAQQDSSLNIRIYQEDEEERTWSLVVKDRDSLAELITKLSGGKLGPAELAKAVLDDDSTQSQDDEDEEDQPDDILLDTGQPEDAKPPGLVNGSHKKKKKKRHDKHLDENADESEASGDEEAESLKDVEKDPDISETKSSSETPTDELKNKAENVVAKEVETDLKRKADDEPIDSKKIKEAEVGEAIEEPVMVVKGEGSGADCEAEFGEAIEEPLMLFCGTGAGTECDTGNPGENKEEEKPQEKQEEPKDNKGDSPSKAAVWSIDQICSGSKANQPSFSMGMMFGNLAKPTFAPSPEKPFFSASAATSGKDVSPESEAQSLDMKEATKTEDTVKLVLEKKLVAEKSETKVVSVGETERTAEAKEEQGIDSSAECSSAKSTEPVSVVEASIENKIAENVPQPAKTVNYSKIKPHVEKELKETLDSPAQKEDEKVLIEKSSELTAESESVSKEMQQTSFGDSINIDEKLPEDRPLINEADRLQSKDNKEKNVEEPPQESKPEVPIIPDSNKESDNETPMEVDELVEDSQLAAQDEVMDVELQSVPEEVKAEACTIEPEQSKQRNAPGKTEISDEIVQKDENKTKVLPRDKKIKAEVIKEKPSLVQTSEKVDTPEPLDIQTVEPTKKQPKRKQKKCEEPPNLEEESKVETKNEPPLLEEIQVDSKPESKQKKVPEEKESEEFSLVGAKVEEVPTQAPLTVASALAFDYDPPASPEPRLTIETTPRATRGRGRPSKRKLLGNAAVHSSEKNPPPSPPVSTPGRGRGRGRGRPPGRQKSGNVGSSAAGSDDGKDIPNEIERAGSAADDSPTKRVSRRIAQIRVKEEEERKKKEEEALAEMQKKRELELLRKKQSAEEEQSSSDSSSDSESEGSNAPVKQKRKYTRRKKKDEDFEADEEIKKRKKKKKKRRRKRKGGGANPWESSDSSDSPEESDGLEPEEDDDEVVPELKSDHEFSPESDLELGPGEEIQPTRRARTVTAKREKAQKAKEAEEEVDEYRCQKCQSGDQPEMIILCDSCDQGWHISCLKPEMHLVPEGDWYCPTCGQNRLIDQLTSTLREFDKSSRKRSNAELRKQRLAYVGISLSNIIASKDDEETEESEDQQDESNISEAGSEIREALGDVEEDDNASSGSPTSSSESEEKSAAEDEEMYPLRQRRAAATVKYDFQEYDELINSAIQDEVDLVKGAGNQGKGKDIANIVDAQEDEIGEKEEKEFEPEEKEDDDEGEKEDKDDSEEDEDDDDDDDDLNKAAAQKAARERERQEIIANAQASKKKHKKKSIACLDVSSGDDDHASDADFVGSDSDFEEDEEEADSGDSEEYTRRRKGSSGPVRRSNRARQARYDRDFIDDSEASDSDAKKKKIKKGRAKGWLGSDFSDSADSESEDSDWGRKKKSKRKAPPRPRVPSRKKKRGGKKKGKSKAAVKRPPPAPKDSDSDKPVVKKPRPPKQERPLSPLEKRTTRGKKINYQEIIGSDSDDPKPSRTKVRKAIVSDDDEDDFKPEEEAPAGKVTPSKNGTVGSVIALTPDKVAPRAKPTPSVLEPVDKLSSARLASVEPSEEPLIPTTLNPIEKFSGSPAEAAAPSATQLAFSPNKFPFHSSPGQPPPAYQARPLLSRVPPQPAAAFRGGGMPMRPRFESKELVAGVGRGQYQPPPAYQQGPQPFYYGAGGEEYYESFPQEPPPTYEVPPQAQRPGGVDEEPSEFGGLVSYFSSQREDDLES